MAVRNARPGMLLDPGDPITKGLVGWWPMWEGAGGKCLDISGKNNHGTLTNGPVWADGVKFDGTNDYVNAGGAGNFTNTDFSIVFSSYDIANASSGQVYIYKGQFQANGWYIQKVPAAGIFKFVTNQSGANQETSVPSSLFQLNVWNHTVVTRSGASVKIYLNGRDVTIASASHIDPASSSDNLQFGQYATVSGSFSVNGFMKNGRLFSRALSALEAEKLFLNPNAGLWVPDTKRYYLAAAGGGADVRKQVIQAYRRAA